jgi:hypothetical protein
MREYARWKIVILAFFAKALGVQFKIKGLPYGAYQYHHVRDGYFSQSEQS